MGGASHADLTEAIQDYVFYQRIELVGRQALRYVHELTAFPELWALYPSPFAMPEDDRAWLRLLKIAAWRSSERATYTPPDVVVRRRPFCLTPELQRNLKKLVVVLDFMRQLIPYHEAVDTSLWPSPFDESVSKRQWENVFFNIRSAIRLLQKEADDVQSSDYKDGEHGVAERLTEGGAHPRWLTPLGRQLPKPGLLWRLCPRTGVRCGLRGVLAQDASADGGGGAITQRTNAPAFCNVSGPSP